MNSILVNRRLYTNYFSAKYKRVEYLESTGTQFIRLDLLITSTTGVYGKTIQIGSDTVFGCNNTQILPDKRFYMPMVQNWVVCYGYGDFVITDIQANSIEYETSINFLDDRKVIFNNSLIALLPNVSFGDYRNVILFGFGYGSNLYRISPSRIYALKISERNNIIHDFIPCYRKEDNVAGMYDIVSGVFYTNAGTGSFVVGADID